MNPAFRIGDTAEDGDGLVLYPIRKSAGRNDFLDLRESSLTGTLGLMFVGGGR